MQAQPNWYLCLSQRRMAVRKSKKKTSIKKLIVYQNIFIFVAVFVNIKRALLGKLKIRTDRWGPNKTLMEARHDWGDNEQLLNTNIHNGLDQDIRAT